MTEAPTPAPTELGPAVVVDTDVYSRVVLPGRGRGVAHPDKAAWQDVLLGYRLLIAVQTRVELLVLPLLGKNPLSEKRTVDLENHVNGLTVLQVTDAVQAQFVTLTGELRQAGNALGNKIHTADRWIAATAVAHGLPVASMDGIYQDVPGLDLLRPED